MSESIKQRVRKLLNLARDSGATEAEAANAMSMASALMLKYNIEVTDEPDAKTVGMSKRYCMGYSDSWHITCSSAAAMLYSCKNIVHNRGQAGYSFVGRLSNGEMAGETMEFLINQVEVLYKQYLPRGLSKEARAEFRRTFKQAAAMRLVNRVWEILEQMKKDDNKALEYTGSKALVIVESIKQQLKEAEDFMKQQIPGVKTMKTRVLQGGSGTRAGIEAGNRIEINRKV